MGADDRNMEVEDGDDEIMLFLVEQLGGHGCAYARDRKRAFRRVVSEIYSPPRVTGIMRGGGVLQPGVALDLTTTDPHDGQPWDFDRPEKRTRARTLLHDQEPILVIGSPACKAFSTWQAFNNEFGPCPRTSRIRTSDGASPFCNADIPRPDRRRLIFSA